VSVVYGSWRLKDWNRARKNGSTCYFRVRSLGFEERSTNSLRERASETDVVESFGIVRGRFLNVQGNQCQSATPLRPRGSRRCKIGLSLRMEKWDDSIWQFSLEAVRPTRWTMSVSTKRASMVADCAHLVDEKFFEQIRNSPIFPAQQLFP